MMTALLASTFTLGVLIGLALALFLSTVAECRCNRPMRGSYAGERVCGTPLHPRPYFPYIDRGATKATAPMSLQEAWAAERERLQRGDILTRYW